MKQLKFLFLIFLTLFVIPIAKADGCGIVCPHGNDLLTFSLSMLCNFFTWGFCHIFAFIILAIAGILIFVFWKKQDEDKRKTIKMFLYALFGIFILVILYPYIKSFAYTPVSVPDSCSISPNSVCVLSESDGITSLEHNPQGHTEANYWTFTCLYSGPTELLITAGTGTVTLPSGSGTGGVTYPAEVTNHGGSSYTLDVLCPSS
jgi:hypothetical protein